MTIHVDFATDTVVQSRKSRGATSHAKGQAAEQQVAQWYARNLDADILHTRWRGTAGELDLILKHHDTIICVEVKASTSHDRAAHSLSHRQTLRLMQTAEEFIGTQPAGSLTPMRLDVALVDQTGRIEVLENALMGF